MKCMVRSRRYHLFAALIIALLMLSLNVRMAVRALQAGVWTTPQWIPGLMDTTVSQYPIFVVDPTGKVHIFHSQWVEGRYGIVYSNWTVGVGWTNPVDILLPESGQIRITGAFLDNAGMMNILFWRGDDQNADIYFTQTPLQSVDRSSAWSEPALIGDHALSLTTAAMASDQKGNIVVVYSGNEKGNGLYSVISRDGGTTWAAPTLFYSASSNVLWPSELRMLLTSDGTIHAVWALGDTTGNSLRVYHASLEQGQDAWNEPTVLAEAIGYEADTPSIIEHDGELFVIYHNDNPTTRWMIRSKDGGLTWTLPARLFEQVGSNGAAALVYDSSDTLHMFFGNRVGSPIIHGLWHSTWNGESWSIPEAIVSGPQILGSDSGEEGFDPSHAQAVIIQGNLLLVAWRHDPMAGPVHIWYSYSYLDTPQLPTAEVNWPQTPTALSENALGTPGAIVSTQAPHFVDDVPTKSDSREITNTLVIGILPAVVLIFAIIVYKRKVH